MRSSGYEGRVLLVGEETELPYRRTTVSKELLRGDKTADGVRIKPEQWYADQAVELLTDTQVASLEPGAVVTAAGNGWPSTSWCWPPAVVPATRSTVNPSRLASSHLRTSVCAPCAASRTCRSRSAPRTPVVIVGAGLIGC